MEEETLIQTQDVMETPVHELDQVLEPYMEKFTQSGLTKTEAVAQLLRAQEVLEQHPQAAIEWLSNAYGVGVDQAKYPHMPKVKEDIEFLVQSGRALDLHQAYEMATWAHPEIREELLKNMLDEKVNKQVEHAQAAKKAASINLKGDVLTLSQNPKTLRESLTDVYDQLTN